MRKVFLLLLLVSSGAGSVEPRFDNPLLRQRADPHAFLHSDGQYYVSATVAEWDRIEIRRTRDLDALGSAEAHVIWRKHASGPMSAHIWAPEIHFIDGKWYVYFTASRADAIWEVRPYVLMNASADPFQGEWREMGRLETGWDSFSLDGTTFTHKGKRYFVWTQRGRNAEEGRGTNIYVARMTSPTAIDTSRVALLTRPEYEWEKRKYDVNEGPAVIIRNGRVFMTFSASAIDANYCLGLLTANADADLLDSRSWTKSKEPVFTSSETSGLYGPGHNGFTTTVDGKTDLFLYHARDYREILGSELADPNRHTRVQVLHWNPDGTPDFGQPLADAGKIAPKPLYRDPISDGAADPVVVYSGSYGRWYMYYTNRRAKLPSSEGKGVEWVHGTRIGMAESLDAGVTWRYVGEANIDIPAAAGMAEVDQGATQWAPDVVRDDLGVYHMFLTAVPGVFADWNHSRTIWHLKSKDLRNWSDAQKVTLPVDRAIDAGLIRMPDRSWRLYYNNEADGKSIWYADSPDLQTWTDRGKVIGDQAGEGPKPFQWRGKWWLITDVWSGLAVYRSDDGAGWIRQKDNLLSVPGQGADDRVKGQHADVVVNGERAWLFYFTHPERHGQEADSYATRRSAIQVVELGEKDGMLTADRDVPARVALRAP
jgi:GH43 family beta-xylosidase